MAFPYIFEENFESGGVGLFDVETDTEARLDFPHYSELARTPGVPMPWRGAYLARVALANDGTPADAYLQETGSLDLSAEAEIYLRIRFYVSDDIVMANTNEFAIFQLWSSTSTVEGGAYINFTTANGLRIGIGETSASSFADLTTGVWHDLELYFVIDDGGSDDGTIDAWLDGVALTQVTGLDQGAITSGVLGVLGQDSGTTTGFVYFDQIVADDARLYRQLDRFPREVVLTKSSHVFVGQGEIENVTLESGNGTDCVLTLYDTDVGNTNDFSNRRVLLRNTVAYEIVDPAGTPGLFQRGCYCQLEGTTPAATVKIKWAPYYGEAGMRTYSRLRKPNPIEGV